MFLITEILIIYYHYTKKGSHSGTNSYSTNNLISSSQHKTFGNKFPWECR